MSVRSSGILLYRTAGGPAVWLGHMGGPFWRGKDAAAWSIPKGEVMPGEADLTAALREFAEETGSPAPAADYAELTTVRLSSGKTIVVFSAQAEFSPAVVTSNTFELEWPPRSGRRQSFPEIDGGRWFPLADARRAMVKGHLPMLDALERRLADG